MNDPMEKYAGFRSAIGCCESMAYRAGICPDEIKRYVVGPVGTKVEVVFASRRDIKGITVQVERFNAPAQPNVARPSEQFNQVDMHTRHHDDQGDFSNSQRD
jgi:hypothetical protein